MTKIGIVDACRTPFQRMGTAYARLSSYDLAREALLGIKRKMTETRAPDGVIMGTVVHSVNNPNVARDAMLGAGIASSVPAYTVSMACISANRAITNACDQIRTGHADYMLAGGVDSLSDAPVMVSLPLRRRLLAAQKIKNPLAYFSLLKGMKMRDLVPQGPAIKEFTTGLTMGQDADRLAAEFGVTREEQDQYAFDAHQKATRAWGAGWMDDDVLTMRLSPKFEALARDNTFREDSSLEKLANLRPVFVKPHGTVTAGNASPLTDGAAVVALMSEKMAKAEGKALIATIEDYVYTGQNPDGELLLGPAYSIPALLKRNKLKLSDIDVFELHEAFAGQVLANLNAMESKAFCKNRLGLAKPVGAIDRKIINSGGGSISLGHPFGATGARLVATAARRLHREDGELALVSACAAGGLGSAILLRRC